MTATNPEPLSNWSLGEKLALSEQGRAISIFFDEFAECCDDELFMGELITTLGKAAGLVRNAVIEALIADAEAAGDNDNVLCFYDDQDGQFHPESPSSLAAYLRRYLQGDTE